MSKRYSRRLACTLLTGCLVASMVSGMGLKTSAAPTKPIDVIIDLVGSSWRALVGEDEGLLDQVYSSSAQRAKHLEQVKLLRHWMIPIREGNAQYIGFDTSVSVKAITSSPFEIEADVIEITTLRWKSLVSDEENQGTVRRDHRLRLTSERGRWVIDLDEYQDEYSYLKDVKRPETMLVALRQQLEQVRSGSGTKDLSATAHGASEQQTKDNASLLGTSPVSYNRSTAVQFARDFAITRHPAYTWFGGSGDGGDCTNFASQVLLYGGGEYDKEGEWVWWYDHKGTTKTSDDSWSPYTWTTVGSFRLMLRENYRLGEHGPKAIEMIIDNERWSQAAYDFLFSGDFIQYSWDGVNWTHTAVVVGWDYTCCSLGEPKVAQHSSNQLDVSWRKGSVKTRLLHITAQH